MSGEVSGTQGRGHQSIPTYRSFTCGDDIDITSAANTLKMRQWLCGVLGLTELTYGCPRERRPEEFLCLKSEDESGPGEDGHGG